MVNGKVKSGVDKILNKKVTRKTGLFIAIFILLIPYLTFFFFNPLIALLIIMVYYAVIYYVGLKVIEW